MARTGPPANTFKASTTCGGLNRLQDRTTTGRYSSIDFKSSFIYRICYMHSLRAPSRCEARSSAVSFKRVTNSR
ncbi:hypothetical protein PS2_021145 [Malus domestica]